MGSIILYSGRCVNPVFILVWAKYCISKFKFHLSRLWASLVAQRVKIMRSYFVEGCEHKWKKCKSMQNILSQKSGQRCLSGLDWERREGTQSGLSCCWVAQSCLTLCARKDCSTSGSSILHSLLEFAPTHVQRVGDAIQPSHPRLSFCLQPLPASESFLTSQLFASGGQSPRSWQCSNFWPRWWLHRCSLYYTVKIST